MHISRQCQLLDTSAQEHHQSVVIHFDAQFIDKAAELRRFRRWIQEKQNPALFIPEIAQQFHFAIGKIILRPDNHYRFHFGRNRIQVEKVQLLKLDVFVFDKRFQHRDRASAF